MLVVLLLGVLAVLCGLAVVRWRRQIDRWNESVADRHLPYSRKGVAGSEHARDRVLSFMMGGVFLICIGVGVGIYALTKLLTG